MSRQVLRKPLTVVVLLVMALLMVAPAWAASWDAEGNHIAPLKYAKANILSYTRGQYEDFYIDYGGSASDTNAPNVYHVGALYPVDVWDQVIGEARYGYCAATPSNLQHPAAGTNPADIQDYLNGFQFLQDPDQNGSGGNDYLIDADYLNTATVPVQVGGSTIKFSQAYIMSPNIHDYSVPIGVTPTGQTSYGPTAPNGNDANNIACNSNSANGFVGQAWFPATPPDSSGNYTWDQATVQVATNPGPINLTQSQATWYLFNGIGSNLSTDADYPTTNYPDKTWHGQCTVSFPYHVFVSGLTPASSNLSSQTQSYTFTVTNQTPLAAKANIRVYTLGDSDGKWTLQQEWDEVTIPSVNRNVQTGEIEQPGPATDSAGDSFPAVADGIWTQITPQTTFQVPDPAGYRVVATVNLDVNTAAAGLLGDLNANDLTYEPLDGTYDAGGLVGLQPPGEPALDTTDCSAEFGGYLPGSNAQQAFNLSTPVQLGYNDHAVYYNAQGSGGGNTNPSGPPPPTTQTFGYTQAGAITATDSAGNTLTSGTWPDNGSSTKGALTFTLSSTFSQAGTATVYFYGAQGSATGPIEQIGSAQTVPIAANGSTPNPATATLSGVSLYADSPVFASVDCDLIFNGVNPSVNEGFPFQEDNGNTLWENPPGATGQANGYIPAAYSSGHYTAAVLGTPPQQNIPITPNVHPTTYPPMVTSIKTVTTTTTTPIMGWQKLYIPLPPPPKLRERLIF